MSDAPLIDESDVTKSIAARMRIVGGVKIISYAVDDGHSLTFLFENGQRFRIGRIRELEAGETIIPNENDLEGERDGDSR